MHKGLKRSSTLYAVCNNLAPMQPRSSMTKARCVWPCIINCILPLDMHEHKLLTLMSEITLEKLSSLDIYFLLTQQIPKAHSCLTCIDCIHIAD